MLRCSFRKRLHALIHRLPEVQEEHPQGVLEEVRLSVPTGKHRCEMICDMNMSTTFCTDSFFVHIYKEVATCNNDHQHMSTEK